MRRVDLGLGTFHHVLNRGSRGMDIVRDNTDRWNFVRSLFFQNDMFICRNWKREVGQSHKGVFHRPDYWPQRKPLVSIVGFCLLNNHFHLLIKEISSGGLSKFMQRLPNSMSLQFNKKYGGRGSIFQGSYQSRLIESDADLRNIAFYIVVKNTFERYENGGINGALKNFEDAWQWAINDPFSSFADYVEERSSPILQKEALEDFRFDKKEVCQYLEHWQEKKKLITALTLE